MKYIQFGEKCPLGYQITKLGIANQSDCYYCQYKDNTGSDAVRCKADALVKAAPAEEKKDEKKVFYEEALLNRYDKIIALLEKLVEQKDKKEAK